MNLNALYGSKKNAILMKYLISLIFLSCFLFGNHNTTGNTGFSIKDSIIHQANDTIIDSTQKHIDSSIDSLVPETDSIIDSSQMKSDTTTDSSQVRLNDSLQPLLNALERVRNLTNKKKKDTTLSEKVDTTWNLSRLNDFIKQDTLDLLSDTIKNSLKNVLWHYNYPPVDSSISLLKKHMQSDTLFQQNKDSLKIRNVASLRRVIENLIKETEKVP